MTRFTADTCRAVRPASRPQSDEDAFRPTVRRPRIHHRWSDKDLSQVVLSANDRRRAAALIKKRLPLLTAENFIVYIICLAADPTDGNGRFPLRPFAVRAAAVGYVYSTLGCFYPSRFKGQFPIADFLPSTQLSALVSALLRESNMTEAL